MLMIWNITLPIQFKIWVGFESEHYSYGNVKLSILFVMEPGDRRLASTVYGMINRARCWIRVLRTAGTISDVFNLFINPILNGIGIDEKKTCEWH
mmetsp:Transcript_21257/g.29800  ORF Transcript_21257/g.29800 Transcript_21257/m.29800 type:complete len:95 (-) Transcript_21257:366-650(-)